MRERESAKEKENERRMERKGDTVSEREREGERDTVRKREITRKIKEEQSEGGKVVWGN